jgi:hypothetical protein
MKKIILALMMVGILLGSLFPIFAASSTYDKFLTVTDVQKVSGLSGIKIVPKDPSKGAGGDLNFATTDGNMVMMANFSSASYFRKQPSFIKAPVAGVGEEAYSCPKDDPQYILYFRKGNFCVTLSSFFNMDSSSKSPTMLTMYQLIALGKIVAPRLK